MQDTIFALSSGAPPAAIGVVRVSGPQAGKVGEHLCDRLPQPRRATLAQLSGADGAILDQALVLWFPGPDTATGEDLLELHCHGGRAVIRAVESALESDCGCRAAEPGEFTRRAFANGRIDLAEAEGLGDLLAAETELQRRVAMQSTAGSLSVRVEEWREAVLDLGAEIEAALDFDDEDDMPGLADDFGKRVECLRAEIDDWLDRPGVEILQRGIAVAIAGPPNAGKSSLINALCEEEVAIATPIAGTTRDIIERGVAWDGVPFLLSDMAGLRDETDDAIEAIGIERARRAMADADIVLWLGAPGEGPVGAWDVATKSDLREASASQQIRFDVSSVTGAGLNELKAALVSAARVMLPRPDRAALNERQRQALKPALDALNDLLESDDLLLMAEKLRIARKSFDTFSGRAATEDMLDRLFSRFCIGK